MSDIIQEVSVKIEAPVEEAEPVSPVEQAPATLLFESPKASTYMNIQ